MTKKYWLFAAASLGRKHALDLAHKVCISDCPVLLMGPTGVGKDVLSEDIHRNSKRATGKFIAVNCAAVSTSIFESEFFGHVAGAYTSAVGRKLGLVELADGGTLFLDEIGELPLEAQAKLLRFLARGTYWPVGSAHEKHVDVRIIAATNRDLRAGLNGSFREDLFYRLSVVTILIPPLRAEDARLLAELFTKEIVQRHHHEVSPSDLGPLADLVAMNVWQGGVREIRNALERYFLLGDPTKTVEHNWCAAFEMSMPEALLRSSRQQLPAPPDLRALIRQLEDLIFLAAAREAGDIRSLAGVFRISPQATYARLRKLGLTSTHLRSAGQLERVLEDARRPIVPHVPWIQALLSTKLSG